MERRACARENRRTDSLRCTGNRRYRRKSERSSKVLNIILLTQITGSNSNFTSTAIRSCYKLKTREAICGTSCARANIDSKSVMRSARFKCIRATLARNGCLSRSRTQPVVRRPTDRYAQFKEESNAKRSGRPRLVHSFSFFSRNRVEIGGEKNEIAMTCWYERTHV